MNLPLAGCKLLIDYMVFTTVFSYIVVASAPIHAFLEFFSLVHRTISFPSHWLLPYIIIAETMESGERGMNPVTMTTIN